MCADGRSALNRRSFELRGGFLREILRLPALRLERADLCNVLLALLERRLEAHGGLAEPICGTIQLGLQPRYARLQLFILCL